MGERMTSVRLRGEQTGTGWAEYGRKTRSEMIAILRERARRDRELAERILAAPDEDFLVETYVGVIVQRGLLEVES